MKVKVINSSSRKTREKIKKAFAFLIKEKKSLNKITVTDLVREADITRSAFYTHYDNIYDVAKEIQDETLDVFETFQSLENINSYFDEIFTYLKKHEDIYSMIFSCDEPLQFTSRLNKMINQWLYKVLSNKKQKKLELNIAFFIDGCMSLVIKHFRNEIDCSLDEINSYMKDTFKKLFNN